MIDDYEEEYYRTENILEVNEQEFFIKKRNGLLFTTPILKNEIIVDDSFAFTGLQQIPQSINFVLDQITLYSTNPDCQRFLPLKISFNNKPLVEFADPSFVAIENYTIVSDTEINLQAITNQLFGAPKAYTISPVDINPTLELLCIVRGDIVYTTSENDTRVYKYNLIDGTRVVQNLNRRVLRLISNEFITVAITISPTSVNENEIQLWNITADVPVLMLTPDLQIEYVDCFVDNYTVILFINDPIIPVSIVRYFTITPQTNLHQAILELTLGFSVDHVDFFRTRRFVAFQPLFPNGALLMDINIDDEGITEVIIREKTVISNPDFPNYTDLRPRFIFAGGSEINNPNISCFRQDGNLIYWDYFATLDDLEETVSFETRTFDLGGTTNLIEIKRYKNTAYFLPFGGEIAYFCNLDNFTFKLWEFRNPQTSIPLADKLYYLVPQLVQNMAIGDKHLVIVGTPDEEAYEEKIIINDFATTRPIDTVYKLTYAYDERIFPYNSTSDRMTIKIALSNFDDITEMEIFKYAIDYRIRFSKQVLAVNEAKEAPVPKNQVERCRKRYTGDKEGFIRCTNKVGDVDRILGYVGDEFNVNDFLNIYTT